MNEHQLKLGRTLLFIVFVRVSKSLVCSYWFLYTYKSVVEIEIENYKIFIEIKIHQKTNRKSTKNDAYENRKFARFIYLYTFFYINMMDTSRT